MNYGQFPDLALADDHLLMGFMRKSCVIRTRVILNGAYVEGREPMVGKLRENSSYVTSKLVILMRFFVNKNAIKSFDVDVKRFGQSWLVSISYKRGWWTCFDINIQARDSKWVVL